jgi:two-component system, OmpR family, response regulator
VQTDRKLCPGSGPTARFPIAADRGWPGAPWPERPGAGRAAVAATNGYSGEWHQRLAREAGIDRTLIQPADPGELKGILDMLAQALKLAERTEALAQQNVELAQETRELLLEVKDELREVKDELREVKDELREVKEERAG